MGVRKKLKKTVKKVSSTAKKLTAKTGTNLARAATGVTQPIEKGVKKFWNEGIRDTGRSLKKGGEKLVENVKTGAKNFNKGIGKYGLFGTGTKKLWDELRGKTPGAGGGGVGAFTSSDFSGEQKIIDDLIAKQKTAGQENLTKQIADRAALRQRYGTEATGLIAEKKAGAADYLKKFTDDQSTRRAELAKILSEQRTRQFNENSPEILEQLGSRGLLHSSGVGTELAREMGKLTSQSEEQQRMQALADAGAAQGLGTKYFDEGRQMEDKRFANIYGMEQDDLGYTQGLENEILKNTQGVEQAGVERQFEVKDLDKEMALARQLGKEAKKANRRKGLTTLLGMGVGGFLGGGPGAGVGAQIGGLAGDVIE